MIDSFTFFIITGKKNLPEDDTDNATEFVILHDRANMDEKLLSSYSFLASLNENGSDLYSAVYIPMCKRAISLYAKEYTSGTDESIQKIIKQEYSIDIPLLVTRKLICLVFKNLSRKDKRLSEMQIFEDGKAFQIKSIAFKSLEDAYQKERRRVNALEHAFDLFLKEETDAFGKIASFSSFILRYKNSLSSFLSGKIVTIEDCITEVSYTPHARFLQFIEKNNDELYCVARNILLGSIIASYIESEVDVYAKSLKKVIYFLDTRIILNALDLQNEEDTRPTRELLSLIKQTGGEIHILDITIAEMHSIIESEVYRFDKNNPTSTINEACVRNGKNKTYLLQLNGNLEKSITECLNATITRVSESDIIKFSKSDDVNLLRQIWFRKNAAEHDVIAYLYVRKRRMYDSNRELYQKASCWFVTGNSRLCNFNLSRKLNGYLNEVILPQELTSLLFLQNPQKYSPDVSSICLNELIALTIANEYPSKDIINEFDMAVKNNMTLSDIDYENLAASISKYSTTQLNQLLEQSVSTPNDFSTQILSIIAKHKTNQARVEESNRILNEKNEKEKNELRLHNAALIEKIESVSRELTDLKISDEKFKEQQTKWRSIMFVSMIVAFVIFIVTNIILSKIAFSGVAYQALTWIKSAGGLWAFFSLIINLIKFMKS